VLSVFGLSTEDIDRGLQKAVLQAGEGVDPLLRYIFNDLVERYDRLRFLALAPGRESQGDEKN
jgi:hypothetical protein